MDLHQHIKLEQLFKHRVIRFFYDIFVMDKLFVTRNKLVLFG